MLIHTIFTILLQKTGNKNEDLSQKDEIRREQHVIRQFPVQHQKLPSGDAIQSIRFPVQHQKLPSGDAIQSTPSFPPPSPPPAPSTLLLHLIYSGQILRAFLRKNLVFFNIVILLFYTLNTFEDICITAESRILHCFTWELFVAR